MCSSDLKDAVPDPGPPYPEPIDGVAVYDYAHVLDKDTELALAESIAAIETRTGAEVALYTQVKPASDTTSEAEADARALMDQWGVGRRGFDDGLVILLDLTDDRCHGQIQLFAGPGFASTFLSDRDRQAIYEGSMLPLLRGEKVTARGPLFWENQQNYAVLDGDWKLVRRNWEKAPRLYRPLEDIGENRNLAAENPQKVAELEALHTAWKTKYYPKPVAPMAKRPLTQFPITAQDP